MKIKQRAEITLETHETTIIRFRQNQTSRFCAGCQRDTPHLSLAQSVAVWPFSEAEILQLAASNQIHSSQTADGRLLLCGQSLAAIIFTARESSI